MAPQLMATNGLDDALAETMNRPRHKLFARAALPRDEHLGVGARNPADGAKNVLNRWTESNDSLERVGRHHASLELPVLPFEIVHVARPAEHDVQLVEVDGFIEKIVRTGGNRPKSVLALPLTGDDDDLGLAPEPQDLAEETKALLHSIGVGSEAEVESDEGHAVRLEKLHRRGEVLGLEHLVLLRERPFHLRADILEIIHNQKLGFLHVVLQSGTRPWGGAGLIAAKRKNPLPLYERRRRGSGTHCAFRTSPDADWGFDRPSVSLFYSDLLGVVKSVICGRRR